MNIDWARPALQPARKAPGGRVAPAPRQAWPSTSTVLLLGDGRPWRREPALRPPMAASPRTQRAVPEAASGGQLGRQLPGVLHTQAPTGLLPKGRQLACRGPGGRSDQGPRLGGQTSRIGTLPPDSWVWTAEQVHFCAVKGDYGTSVNDMTMLGGSFAKTLLERYACVHCAWSGASRVQQDRGRHARPPPADSWGAGTKGRGLPGVAKRLPASRGSSAQGQPCPGGSRPEPRTQAHLHL